MTMDEHPDSALPTDVADLLRDGDGPPPSSEVRARVLERVQGTVAPGSMAAEGTAVGGAQGLGTAVVVLGLVLAVGSIFRPGQGPPIGEFIPGVTLLERADSPTTKGERLVATPMKASRKSKVATSTIVLEQPLVVPVPSPVSKAAVAPVGVVPVSKEASKPPSKPARDIRAERTLLDGARGSLRAGQHKRALQVVRTHRKRFPRGALTEERESLWVRALLGVGDVQAGQKRAKRFIKRFPKSIHRSAVEHALSRAVR